MSNDKNKINNSSDLNDSNNSSNLSDTNNTIDSSELIENDMKIDYFYPEPSDDEFQYKIYKKREFYYHKTRSRPEIKSYEDIKDYRDNICARHFTLHSHQAMLSNFINPDTPYKGLLVFHYPGTGKTCTGVAIAEKFKPIFQKYGTKATVLVGGPLIKETWKKHLLLCTGETYIKYQDNTVILDDVEQIKQEKEAYAQAMQYYRFMSYKSFQKHVIGEKIADHQPEGGKAVYRKTDEGEFERDISVDRIYNLNNSIIIVDEAHNLTGNSFGEALQYIIKNSINLRVILLTGTPMKNLGSDIVELINFIRPVDSQIDKDKIFEGDRGHTLTFKNGGLDYLKNMMKGYVSYVRGTDPLTFAKRIDKGVKPKGLTSTRVTRSFMLDFQKEAYNKSIKDIKDDRLDRKSEAVANFVFPGLTQDKKELTGYFAGDGYDTVRSQLKSYEKTINEKLSKLLFGNTNENELLYLTQDGKSITGKILRSPYLKYFSIKFYKALKKISRLVEGKKGVGTAFIYSNLVRVGISLFAETLIQNGYLEYQENSSNYQINQNTICYFCGKPYSYHISDMNNNEIKITNDTIMKELDISPKSTEYENNDNITTHVFKPATFITVTGKSTEETIESMPEEKINIIKNVFNSFDNRDGKYIKFVLGSRVMNEGISLFNVREVHILDAYYNFGRIDQVIGRAIRYCSHYKVMSEKNIYPEVNVYKYVISIKNKLTTEEELYQKAEMKYFLIKKIERAMKTIAIDCSLNVNANIFPEEVEQYKDCDDNILNEENKENDNVNKLCPSICDYTKCDYKCDDVKLNYEFYDPNRKMYKQITKDNLDYSTFTKSLSRNEIDLAKDKIKEMYIFKYIYTLEEIINYVKKSYNEEQNDLFDEFFVFKALDELIPITENDFNNFKDTIIDRQNTQGYLIYVNKYYIFQPFNQKRNIPMYYRTHDNKNINLQLSLYNYLKGTETYQQFNESGDVDNETHYDKPYYNFEDVMDYYDSRKEYDYVGFIDKELSRRKNKSMGDLNDVFKIRERRAKILEKKRATGIPSLKGAVCVTAKGKKYLERVAKKLNIDLKNDNTRHDICSKIRDKLLFLEKYATDKDNNKFTYIMIPLNHAVYKFPYNLEDRVEYIINKLKTEIDKNLIINKKVEKHKTGTDKGYPYYILTIKNSSKIDKNNDLLKSYNAIKNKDNWIITVD